MRQRGESPDPGTKSIYNQQLHGSGRKAGAVGQQDATSELLELLGDAAAGAGAMRGPGGPQDFLNGSLGNSAADVLLLAGMSSSSVEPSITAKAIKRRKAAGAVSWLLQFLDLHRTALHASMIRDCSRCISQCHPEQWSPFAAECVAAGFLHMLYPGLHYTGVLTALVCVHLQVSFAATGDAVALAAELPGGIEDSSARPASSGAQQQPGRQVSRAVVSRRCLASQSAAV
jgi:hypothetical protein